MGLARMRAAGWRARAGNSHETGATGGLRCGLPGLIAVAPLACLSAALIWTVGSDPAGATASLNRFSAIHVIAGAGLTALGLYALLSLLSGIGGMLLAIADAFPQVALGSAMMAVLPFAQPADPPEPAAPSSGAQSAARSEMQIGLYGGVSQSPNSDVRMVAPDDTDLTLKDVVWKSESLKPSPYYGGRGVDWNSRFPNFGLMVDFTHAKATAIRSQTINEQEGRRSGVDIPPSEPFEKTFRKLEFTHGLNMLTFNGLFRAAGLHRRIIPYVGLGIGFVVPHVEARRAGQEKEDAVSEAQVTGLALQGLAGIEWRIFKSDRRSIFTEYKFAHTSNDVKLHSGGNVTTDILVHQFILGGYFTPWRQAAVAGK